MTEEEDKRERATEGSAANLRQQRRLRAITEPAEPLTLSEAVDLGQTLLDVGVPRDEAMRRLAEIAKDDAALDADEATP